jgi:hypothetical protein
MVVLNIAIMCQKIKFVLSALFLLFAQVFFSQVIISIPQASPHIDTVNLAGNTAEHRKPLGTYFGYERTAIVYANNEIPYLGEITSIAVYCDSIDHPGDVPLNIYIRERSDSTFTGQTTVANEEAGASLVYSGTITGSSFVKNQWITIHFTNPFVHAEAKAVEFIFETNASGTGNEGISGKFFTHYTPTISYYTSEYWTNDNNPPPSIANTLSFNRPNVQIGIIKISSCLGTPNAGTILSTNDTLCLDSSFVLSLTGVTKALGLNYQWQDSVVGATSFTNIQLADSNTLLTGLSSTTWYRCAVTCQGQTAYSGIKEVALRSYLQCHCSATNLGGGCSFNTAIDSIAIENTSLANGLTGCSPNNYSVYPTSGNTTATLNRGQTYNLDSRFNGNVSASFWIDYNQNGVFEDNEWEQICTQSPSIYDTATVNGVFTTHVDSLFITAFIVPSNAAIGFTLLRVRSRAGGNPNDSSTVCAVFSSGETEDYHIYIDYPLGIQKTDHTTFEISIFPNPANNKVTLMANFARNENVYINLYDLNGASVFQTENRYTGEPLMMDVSLLEAGIYFIKISTNENTTTKKIIINK